MSEYQYYEFQALDQPLTTDAQQEMQRLSSRVQLTASSASFVYNYSDFRGNPYDILAKYFDAMLYMTNWGTRQIMFRFPRLAIPAQIQAQYQYIEYMDWSSIGNYTILNIAYHDESGDWGWVEGEGWLPGIASLRNDILRGDYRALYLAWLDAASYEFEFLEDDEDLTGPPIPPNLQKLSPALKNFAEFFELDSDLLTVATQYSPTVKPSDEVLSVHLARLPASEKDTFLERLLHGEAHLDIALAARLRELAGPIQTAPPKTKCSLRQLMGEAQQLAEQRQADAQKQAEIKRLKNLERIAQQESELWGRIPGLIGQKKTSAYDEAVRILKDLRSLAEHRGRLTEFQDKMIDIQDQYPTLRGLHRRMCDAGLMT
ncbi:hypothetical protein ACFLYO_09770 [Chloroflexota bacterium]